MELKAIHYPLTSNIGEYATILLNKLVDSPGFSVKREFVNGQEIESSQIYFNDRKVVYIANGCNGFIALMRYVGFIFCFPSKFRRKLYYIIFGVLILYILNIFRCAGLAYINLYHRPFFDPAHDLWFKWTIHGITFILWIFYLRKVQFPQNFKSKKVGIA